MTLEPVLLQARSFCAHSLFLPGLNFIMRHQKVVSAPFTLEWSSSTTMKADITEIGLVFVFWRNFSCEHLYIFWSNRTKVRKWNSGQQRLLWNKIRRVGADFAYSRIYCRCSRKRTWRAYHGSRILPYECVELFTPYFTVQLSDNVYMCFSFDFRGTVTVLKRFVELRAWIENGLVFLWGIAYFLLVENRDLARNAI